jgi:hypothetical protein
VYGEFDVGGRQGFDPAKHTLTTSCHPTSAAPSRSSVTRLRTYLIRAGFEGQAGRGQAAVDQAGRYWIFFSLRLYELILFRTHAAVVQISRGQSWDSCNIGACSQDTQDKAFWDIAPNIPDPPARYAGATT